MQPRIKAIIATAITNVAAALIATALVCYDLCTKLRRRKD